MTEATLLNAIQGQCLCGKVKVTAAKANAKVGACHCGMCRKLSSGPYLAIDCGSDVTFEGQENVKTFDSSQWAERAFCSNCGSNLFYRLKQNNQHMLSLGLFDKNLPVTFDHQVFIDEKPEYYTFANKTHDMTGAEIFAQYGGK